MTIDPPPTLAAPDGGKTSEGMAAILRSMKGDRATRPTRDVSLSSMSLIGCSATDDRLPEGSDTDVAIDCYDGAGFMTSDVRSLQD